MTTKKEKALLIIIGLVITILVLEISLRLSGFVYNAYRISNKKIAPEEDKDVVKILCLGDSFTFGLGAESGQDYPAQLERLLNENFSDKKFIVYNKGIPGQNSSMVLKRLPGNIEKYSPKIIILLIGSNNKSVLLKKEDSNYYLFKKTRMGEAKNFLLKLDIALSKLKIYKLIRISSMNLKNKLTPKVAPYDISADTGFQDNTPKPDYGVKGSEGNNEKVAYLRLAEVLCDERKFSAAEKAMEKMPGGYNLMDRRECFVRSNIYYEQEKYDQAIATLEVYFKNNPKDAETIFRMGRIYYAQGRNRPAIQKDKFEQAIKMFDDSFIYADSDNLWLKGEIYGYLARLYLDQGKNELATRMAENALKCRPNNKFFQQLIRAVSESSLDQG